MTWKRAKLGEICEVHKGNIGITKAIPGEYPLVSLAKELKSHNDYQFDNEAVVIPLVSSTGHGHASMKRIFYMTGKFTVGSILCAVIPKDKTKLSAEFLYRYLDFNKERELVSRMKGMANVSLPMKAIKEVEIPVPPIEYQIELIEEFQKIEDFYNEISIEFEDQLELVSQLRQAFLREAMQGKLVPQDTADEPAEVLLEKIKAEKEKLIAEKKIKKQKPLPEINPEEIPFEIPNNWTWCRLGDICTKIGSGSTPKGSNYSKTGYPFFRSQNIYDEGLILNDINFISDEVHKRMYGTKVVADDILLNITGGSIGRAALVPKDFIEGNVSQHVCIIRSISFNNTFLHKVVLSSFFQHLIFDSTTGAGRKGLPKYNLEQFTIPLPPLAEQKRIVEKLEKLMAYCDELEANIQESKTNAETLLQVALKEALEPK